MPTSKAKTLQSLNPELINGLQFCIGFISDKCYAKGLISVETYTDIIRQNNPGVAQLRVLLLDVTKNIDQSNNFEQFIEILQQDQSILYLADALEKNHREFRQSKKKLLFYFIVLLILFIWPDPLPICYVGKGPGTNVGFSLVGYSEEGVGLVKTKQPQRSAKKSGTASGVETEKNCCGCRSDLDLVSRKGHRRSLGTSKEAKALNVMEEYVEKV